MVKAIATFSVTGPEGRTVTFAPGDVVPDAIAATVGAHVLDSKPDADVEIPEGADEAVVKLLEDSQAYVKELEDEVEKLQDQVEELTAFKEKLLSGDLTDLNLDELAKDGIVQANDGAGAGNEPVALYDPDEHNVPDVLAYLEGADEAEDKRVRAAEKTGQNRKGIVGDE